MLKQSSKSFLMCVIKIGKEKLKKKKKKKKKQKKKKTI
jgi:hypothetical protein